MNTHRRAPAWPSLGAAVWLLASSFYLFVVYEPFTPDSYVYVAAATQAQDTGHFTLPFAPTTADSLPVPLSGWPPGYPALITLGSAVGVDAWLAARGVAAASMIILFVAGGWLARKAAWVQPGLACVCGMSAVVTVTAWSEGPFALALGVAVAALILQGERDEVSFGAAVVFAAATAAALFIRHAGWFVVPAFAWHLLHQRKHRTIAAFALVLACIPAAVWLASHFPSGLKVGAALEGARLFRVTGQTAAALGKLVVVPWSSSAILQAILGTALICGLATLQWRERQSASAPVRCLWVSGWSFLAGTWLVGLVNPASFFATDRLLWPAWLLFGLAAGSSLLMLTACARQLALAALLITQTAGVIRYPQLEARQPLPKQHIQVPGQLPRNQAVVSNESWRAWRLWGVPGYHLPRAHQGHGMLAPDTLALWAARHQVRYLVWFADGLTEEESLRRYGPLGLAGYGKPAAILDLVASDSICHTYRIQSTRAH